MPDHFENTDKEAIGVLRNAHMKQVQLTLLVDQKANMLMGIILVTFSVISSNIAISEFNNVILKLAFVAFGILELLAVVMSLLVIFPRLGPKVRKEFLTEKHNPLYFMHFLSLEKEAFNELILENMKSPESVYKLLLNDFYDMGSSLNKKYVMLQRAYLTAAAGLLPAIFIMTLFLS